MAFSFLASQLRLSEVNIFLAEEGTLSHQQVAASTSSGCLQNRAIKVLGSGLSEKL